MSTPPDQTWLDALRQHVHTKPCVILRLDESDSGQLHASRRGLNEFTLARAHELCADIKTPTICLIFGKLSEWATPEKIEHFAYIGLVSSRSPVTTLETRIKIKRAVSMAPDTEQAMSALLNGTAHATQLQKKLQSSADLLVLSPKLSGALIDALVAIPANQGPIRAVAESLTAPKRYTNFSAVQEDAVQTALKAFGLAASDRASRVELIDSQSTALARVPLMEDSVIEHDARAVPGYTLSASHITGRALFEKGTDKLEVFTANRRDLEHVFGVDLIYLNLTRKNIVMVQYKMLEPNTRSGEPTDWLYRPDSNMADEIRRMRAFSSAHAAGPLEYRLNPEVFYLKFVRRNGSLSNGSIVTPIDHYERLLSDQSCKGPRGALRISYNTLNGRYMRQNAFLDLIHSGYIGAYADTTAALSTLVEATLQGDRAVVAAVQSANQTVNEVATD